jgi:hypothetical protein
MTGAERAWANHYEVGDIVRYARGSKATGIEAGTYRTSSDQCFVDQSLESDGTRTSEVLWGVLDRHVA